MKIAKRILLIGSLVLVFGGIALILVPRTDMSKVGWRASLSNRRALLSMVYAEQGARLTTAAEQNRNALPMEYELRGALIDRAVREGPLGFRPYYRRLADTEFVLVDAGEDGVAETCFEDIPSSGSVTLRPLGDDVLAWGELKRGVGGELYISGPARLLQAGVADSRGLP